MPRVIETSLFRRIDIDDASAIRRIMAGLQYFLARNVLRATAPELTNLSSEETQIVHAIFTRIRLNPQYPLLLEAILQFIDRKNERDQGILEAARELQILGDSRVLLSPETNEREYLALKHLFDATRAKEASLVVADSDISMDTRIRAPGAFWQQTYRSTLSHPQATDLELLIKRGPSTYVPPGSVPLNANRCIECKDAGITCSKEEPACWSCRRFRELCHYTTNPSPSIQKASPYASEEFDGTSGTMRTTTQVEFYRVNRDYDEPLRPTRAAEKRKYYFEGSNNKIVEHRDIQEDASSNTKKRRVFTSDKGKGKAVEMPKFIITSSPSESSTSSVLSEHSDSEFLGNGLGDDPFVTFPLKNNLTQNKPVRKPGERAIDDGSYNHMARIPIGEPNPSLLHLRFHTERDDPDQPGEIINGSVADYWYAKPVYWKVKKSVDALKKWRTQIFSRNFGTVRQTRYPWLGDERDALLEILQAHLSKIGGRWLEIDWEFVASQYNRRFNGITQKAGSMTAGRRYRTGNTQTPGQEYISAPTAIPADRTAPTRSAGSMRSQIENFSHLLAKQIVTQAKNRDKKLNRQATREILDSAEDGYDKTLAAYTGTFMGDFEDEIIAGPSRIEDKGDSEMEINDSTVNENDDLEDPKSREAAQALALEVKAHSRQEGLAAQLRSSVRLMHSQTQDKLRKT